MHLLHLLTSRVFVRVLSTEPKTAKKAPKPPQTPQTTYMFPSLHRHVLRAVADQIQPKWAKTTKKSRKPNNVYDTNLRARFTCVNKACSSGGWSSNIVAIRIRGFPDCSYDTTVYNQRCKHCEKLGLLHLDLDSYVERVAYRLKKWANVEVETPPYMPKETPPHKRELCEGCRNNLCQQGHREE